MIKFTVDIKPKEWHAVSAWSKTYRQKMIAAMRNALSVMTRRIVLNLSGMSHTLFPGNGNPFPGTISGRMKNSVSATVRTRSNIVKGVVGPNVYYAVNHVLGRGVPKRDFLTPALKKEQAKINRILRDAIKDAMK